MSGFSADWLALREPYDHRARALAAIPGLGADDDPAPPHTATSGPLRLVDLGCGSGSNLRYLGPRLGGVQHWRLLDNDPQLLARLQPRLHDWAASLPARFDEPSAGHFEIEAPGLRITAVAQLVELGANAALPDLRPGECVTASALLDLVSARWLDTLIDACVAGSHPLLWALSYDGRVEWAPHDRLDAFVHARFDQHQRGDKGFGPALGPAAASHALERLSPRATTLLSRRSDWVLGPRDREIQQSLVNDWQRAASEVAPEHREDIDEWARRRHAFIEAGSSHLTVGHLDLAAGFSR